MLNMYKIPAIYRRFSAIYPMANNHLRLSHYHFCFLSHLPDGEHDSGGAGAISSFLSHLPDGEPTEQRMADLDIFLSHLPDGEPLYRAKSAPALFLSHLPDGEPVLRRA